MRVVLHVVLYVVLHVVLHVLASVIQAALHSLARLPGIIKCCMLSHHRQIDFDMRSLPT